MKYRTGYLFKRGDTFYVSWRVNGRAFTKALRDENGQAVTTKREAEEARAKLMAPFLVADEAAALEYIAGKLAGRKAELAKLEDKQNPPLPISQAWTEFLASPNRPDSGEETLYQYQCQFSAFVGWLKEKHAEVLTLRGVTREIAEEYAGSLSRAKLSPNTYNKYLSLLTLVFRVLKRKAKITENPWEEIQRKALTTHTRRELTVDELRKVCEKATGEMRLLLALGVYSGLRLGDCATLRWGETDLRRSLITRIPNKTGRRKPKPVLVPIHPALRDMLAKIPTEQRDEYVLPETAALYRTRIDLVTTTIQNHFKACGIRTHKPGTGQNGESGERAVIEVGFHSLRHTFVSLCRESNAPLAVVESIVGHTSPAMTRHYTHVGTLAAGQAVAALPYVTGEARPESEKREEGAIVRDARAILDDMSEANWREKKAALMALLSPEAALAA